MPTAANVYVVGQGIGDTARCKALLDEIAQELRTWNLTRRQVNCWIRILFGPGDVADEPLDETRVAELSGGPFPFLYLNVTYDPTAALADKLRALEERYDLRLLATGQSKATLFP